MTAPRDLINRTLAFWQMHEGEAPDLARFWIDALTAARNTGESVDRLLGIKGHARRNNVVANRRYLMAYLYETECVDLPYLTDAADYIEDILKLAARSPNNRKIGGRFKLVAAIMHECRIPMRSNRTIYDDLKAHYNETAISL